MSFPASRSRTPLRALALAALLVAGGSPALAGGEDVAEATVVVNEFLQALAGKNMARVGGFFAPGARVASVRLGEAVPAVESFAATDWVGSAGAGIAPIEGFKIEVLETSGLGLGEGVTVSARCRATGAVGGGRFTNESIDTFALVRSEGAWRISIYNSLEKLVAFTPDGA